MWNLFQNKKLTSIRCFALFVQCFVFVLPTIWSYRLGPNICIIHRSNFQITEKAVRSISCQPRLSPSLPIFKDRKHLKLFDIFKVHLLTFVYDSVTKTSPSCFHNIYLFSSSVHRYSTRQASQGDLYLFRKDSLQYGLKSSRYLGAKLWNELPVELRNTPSKISFKKQLKIYLSKTADQQS